MDTGVSNMEVWQIGLAVVLVATPFMVASVAMHFARPESRVRAWAVTFFWAAVPNLTLAAMVLTTRFMR
ncbi:MAG TPA: hypothetical protein PKN64_02955 [Casimicrobium sp.]|jgi:hypothetical protein|nr:hypothetical protein [Casimicrobium sp.]